MTIKEIAKESGYGIGTVSRVLNGSPNVSEKAKEKIMAVVKAHNFTPNNNARHLKLQSNFGIAVIVKGSQNMLLAEILEKMQILIEKNGHVSMIYYIDEDEDEVEQALRICNERKPYGIVFLGSNLEPHKEELETIRVPCITITNSAADLHLKNVSSITIDDMAAADSVIENLYYKGHRNIAIIGGDPELSGPSKKRLMGCQSAFVRLDLDFNINKVYEYAKFSLESGYKAASKLLRKYPDMTAIFAMSDIQAIGAIRALLDNGRKVPEDISVVGFDGVELAEYVQPRLTTVKQNVERFAQRGTEILMYLIDNPGQSVHEIIPYEIVEGTSTMNVGSDSSG